MDRATNVSSAVHLVDLTGISSAKHALGRAEDILLVPVPSLDLDDPLNWFVNRKRLSIASICL